MRNAPNSDNYTLGRGVVYFQLEGTPGELDLGNAPDFSFNIAVEKLDHFSSRSGLRTKDKSVVTELVPSLTFTLDEINIDNIEMAFMATHSEVSQIKDVNVTPVEVENVLLNRSYDMGKRNIGLHKLPYTAQSDGPFDEGETVTGAGGATGVVLKDIQGASNTGEVFIHQLTGTFVHGETITGGTSTATASVNTTGQTTEGTTGAIFDTTEALVKVGSTVFVKTDDYIVDNRTGRIKLVQGGDDYMAIAEDDTVEFTFSCLAETYTSIESFNRTSVEGFMRFVGDVPEGTNLECKLWKVNLTPTGDTALIGDDWSTLQFEGEILKDEANHPDNPFMEIIATEKL